MQRLAQRLEVKTFSVEQGAEFLLRRATLIALDASLSQARLEDRQAAMQIVQELGGLPLALDQAGAYLEATGISPKQYQQIYQQHRHALLRERRARVPDHPEPVATTWSLSFKLVEEHNTAAAELLRLCAYLASDAIPENIITQGAPYLGPLLQPVAADPFLLNQAVEALRAYSLIQRDPQTQTLSVHRLVQTVLRDSMATEAEKQWKQRVVQAVDASCPNVQDVAQWDAFEQWLPHAQVCATWIEQEDMMFPEAAHLLNEAGYYLNDRGRYGEAEQLYGQALTIRERLLGDDHPDTASSLNNLANLYRAQGKYAEAEPLYLQAYSISEQQLGAQHPGTQIIRRNYALLLRKLGRDEEAKALEATLPPSL
jgi:tetratricopeptide (TPR) repeat protein